MSAIRVEALKLACSPVGIIATVALLGGTMALLGGLTMGLASGNPELAAQAKFSGVSATLDWGGMLRFAAQVTSAASTLGFGVVLSWMFGREFADGTIVGLFALPITRARIALAKFAVYALWVCVVAVFLALGLYGLGLLLGYGAPSPDIWGGLLRQVVLAMFAEAVAVPVAWVATVSRSLLAAVGATLGLVVTGQISAIVGAGGWMPLIAPTLWAISNGTAVSAAQLAFTAVVALGFVALSCGSWARLQLSR